MNNQITFKIKVGKLIGKLIYRVLAIGIIGIIVYGLLSTTVFKDDHQTMVIVDMAFIALGILWFVMGMRSLLKRSIVLENRTLFVKKGEEVLKEIDILSYLFDTYVYKQYHNGIPTNITYSLVLKNEEGERSIDCSFLSKGDFNTLISTIRRYQKHLVDEEQVSETVGKAEAREPIPQTVFQISKAKLIRPIIAPVVLMCIVVGVLILNSGLDSIHTEYPVLVLILLIGTILLMVNASLRLVKLPNKIMINDKKMIVGNKEFSFDHIDKIEMNPASKSYPQVIKIYLDGKKQTFKFGATTPNNSAKAGFPEYDIFYVLVEECMHRHNKEFIVKVA